MVRLVIEFDAVEAEPFKPWVQLEIHEFDEADSDSMAHCRAMADLSWFMNITFKALTNVARGQVQPNGAPDKALVELVRLKGVCSHLAERIAYGRKMGVLDSAAYRKFARAYAGTNFAFIDQPIPPIVMISPQGS